MAKANTHIKDAISFHPTLYCFIVTKYGLDLHKINVYLSLTDQLSHFSLSTQTIHFNSQFMLINKTVSKKTNSVTVYIQSTTQPAREI